MIPADIEAVFRAIDRPVWIVTAAAAGHRGGLTATWVAQASLDPALPVVVAGIAPGHHTRELIDAAGAFAAHLLAADQAPLALRFALASGRDVDKLAGVEFSAGATGSPILETCLAWLDCRVVHRHETGDRFYYWADVVAGHRLAEAAPLTERGLLSAANDDEKRRLKLLLAADIAAQRPLRDAWRASR